MMARIEMNRGYFMDWPPMFIRFGCGLVGC